MHDRIRTGRYLGRVDSMSTVIIEGPDGAGKSTLLCRLLGGHPGYRQAPRACSSLGGPPCGADLVAYLAQYGSMDSAIYDRHPAISGAVYDAVLHRAPDTAVGPYLREAFRWVIENARVIYCRPPMDVIVQSVISSPQMDGVPRSIYRVVETYDSIMHHLVPHETYDWTADDLPNL